MIVQVDTREKARAIRKILKTFEEHNIKVIPSKLWVGDYMNLDNPRLIIDRKQNLSELCGNVIQDHKRFTAELSRAQEVGIKILILCEHGNGICELQDVVFWENPRSKKRVKNATGKWVTENVVYKREIKSKNGKSYIREFHPTTGEELYRKLMTIREKYGCEFLFCDKDETGEKIIELLDKGVVM